MMILQNPLLISARLLPAVRIGNNWISFDNGDWIFDLESGQEYIETSWSPGASRDLREWFASILGFLSAALESRSFRVRTGMQGENEDLFPAFVLDAFDGLSDEVSMLSYDLQEGEVD
jgi:hypothetical protein